MSLNVADFSVKILSGKTEGGIMLRQIRVKKNFKQIVDTPLVTGDNRAYEIIWDIGEEAANATLQIIAKRNDLSMICDTCEISGGGVARYILKNNMYAISGSMKLMLSVISGESILTERVLCFSVMVGTGIMESNGEDGPPPFTKVADDVEKLKEHLNDRENPHNVTKEQLGLEYLENAFAGIMTNTASGEGYVSVTDGNEYLKINSIGVLGNCVQEEEPTLDNPVEIVCVENPEITVGGTTAKLNVKLYGIQNVDGEFIARDKIYAEGGKVYISRSISVLDKLSDFKFTLASSSAGTTLFKSNYSGASKSGTYGFCNRLSYGFIYAAENVTGVMVGSNMMYMRLPADEFPDAATVNNKIKEIFDNGGTFEVYYANKEPVITEIEDEGLLSMLELKGNISASVKSNIDAGIEIGYNQKLNGVIEEIKKAIVAMGGEV